MEYKQEDVDRLIDAVESIVVNGITDPTLAFQKLADLGNAYKPFSKPKAARVRQHTFIGEDRQRVVEITDAVKARLGPTAGVDRIDIKQNVRKYLHVSADETAGNIMQLIADAVPEIEGEL